MEPVSVQVLQEGLGPDSMCKEVGERAQVSKIHVVLSITWDDGGSWGACDGGRVLAGAGLQEGLISAPGMYLRGAVGGGQEPGWRIGVRVRASGWTPTDLH